jgi:dienelactone hydrolase
MRIFAGAIAVGWWACAALGAGDRDGSIFDLAGEASPRIVIATGSEPPAPDAEGGMLGALRGIVAVLSKPEVGKLRACEPKEPGVVGRPRVGETIGFVHIGGDAGAKVVELVRGLDGRIVAEEFGTGLERPARVELNADRFEALSGQWARYRGPFDPETVSEPRGETFELAGPYSTGRFILDRTTLGERFLAGGTSDLKAERVLAEEALSVRLPAGYDPRRPAGLLVWVSPVEDGTVPGVFALALDRLNIVALGAHKSGNSRPVAERYQLALDATETCQRRFHIDPRRVYITGMSGGGRVSSMMAACFPDVYTGAVPIVGLSCYERVPTGTGAYWPAGYRQPRAKWFGLFREHRMGAITGDEDFNAPEMRTAAEIMRKDGVAVRLFEYEGMGHVMPTPERFAEVLEWVDEPYQRRAKEDEEAAARALEVYRARTGEKAAGGDALSEGDRRLLLRVLEAGPWTDAAWEAVGVLEGR